MIAAIRRALETDEPAIEYQFVEILRGPAAGCQILLPTPTDLARKIAAGEYETSGTELLQQLIGESDVCYDIGGHYGYYTLVLASLAKNGAVHCFEPVPELSEKINQSLTQSKLGHAHVRCVAMAGEVGQMQFRYASESGLDDSMGYLENYGGVNTPRSQDQYGRFGQTNIQTVTLDSLVDLPDPQFIKIDAEGAEAEILRAGLGRITKSQPRMLIELHGVDLALKCADILGGLGYIGIAAAPRSLMMPVLWLHRQDRWAIDAVKRFFGGELPLLFSKLD